jgi:hypothetical protein
MQTPFTVVTDDVTQCIVVSIRGSSSFADWISDATLDDSYLQNVIKSLNLLDDTGYSVKSPNGSTAGGSKRQVPQLVDDETGDTLRVHGAMFVSANVMLGAVQLAIADLLRTYKYGNYGVVVTGHSLGAGVTALLTIMLRFTTIQTITYSS